MTSRSSGWKNIKNVIIQLQIAAKRRVCLCVLASLILVGCATPQGHFQTKKDPSYQGKLERILIVPRNEDMASRLGRDFPNRLLTRLTSSLAQKDVATEVVHLNKEDVDPDAPIKSKAAQFKANQLLYVSLIRVASRNEARPATLSSLPQFASAVSIVFAFGVVDVQSEKTVWRGNLQFDIIPNPEDVADQLLKQLEAEQLF
jgi:hypothetical protein